MAYPFHPNVAMRLIVWFPAEELQTVVVTLLAGDKAQMGDVFYDSAGIRADAAIEQWQRQRKEEGSGS